MSNKTYIELYKEAERLLLISEITIGEFEKMIEPLSKPITEIVRCKDCEHHFYDIGNQAWFCHEHEYGEIFNDDDFCSWAKMKGGVE